MSLRPIRNRDIAGHRWPENDGARDSREEIPRDNN